MTKPGLAGLTRWLATWLVAWALAVPAARADKPFVTVDLEAVDENGDVTPSSPVQGIIYLSEEFRASVMASYYAEGADAPCELEGAWKNMPQEYRTFGEGNEQGLAYFDSPKTPMEVGFSVSCTNAEGTTTVSKSWQFLALPEAPDQPTEFSMAENSTTIPGAPAAKGVAIQYKIPGVGSGCMVWRETLVDGQWQPVENETGFGLFSLTEKSGIAGAISYSVPANASYPYTERYMYSCLNPVLGFYVDDKLIGTVTYSKPKESREAVVSIDLAK